MSCHPAFRLPATFLEAVDYVNAATDAAVARLDTLPSAYGDTAFDVDRIVRDAIDGINTHWVHALTLQEYFHPGIADNPSALHCAVVSITHDIVNKCAPLELAAIIGNVARVKEQVQTWCACVDFIGIHAHFSSSLKLLESCYPVVRNAALHADLILAALYQSGSVVLPSQHEFEFRHRDFAMRTVHKSPTFVGVQSLGEIGSEPSFELACHLVSAARSLRTDVYCSNCNERPVAAHTRCFPDWCRRCDFSIWNMPARQYFGSQYNRSTTARGDPDQSAAGILPHPSNESQSYFSHTELQCRGAPHEHFISIPP
jgi:hypothetical protein